MTVQLAGSLLVPRWAVTAWWRLHERDSGVAGPDVYGGPTSAPYGRVAGLDPPLAVITETGETPYVCCGYCAAHMACWTAEPDLSMAMTREAHDIRAAAGRGHNAGSNASELRNGARDALGITLEAVAVSEIRGQLGAGLAVAVSLQYADLPDYLKVQGGDFGHGATLYGYRQADDLVGYFDPLWPQGAAGAWARWSDLTPSLWSDGNHSTTLRSWGAPPGGSDVAIKAAPNLTTGQRADVEAGVEFYADANLTQREGSFAKLSTVWVVGAPIGETVAGGSRAIQVTTGSVYSDGASYPTIVYVAADAIDPYSVPPPMTQDVDQALLERDEQWEASILDAVRPPSGLA
jgi:hypothetical protein